MDSQKYDAAIIGLGYVGLPLAYEATKNGLQIAGFDSSRNIVEGLSSGISHIDDLGGQEVQEMLSKGFFPTTDPSILSKCKVIVICVPTPLLADYQPDLSYIEAAASATRDNLEQGHLIILESTTYPGTTAEVVLPILNESGLVAGKDFDLAYSPERVDPGNAKYGVANTPKVCGGLTPHAAIAACEFYSQFIEVVHPVSSLEVAEMTKLLENTYRHVNIALMNEMVMLCAELKIDLWEVIDAASTKPFGYQAFFPGPGVGGHCIPIDPHYLSHRVERLGYRFKFVDLATEISSKMPHYVATRAMKILEKRVVSDTPSKVLLLGVTYKPNIRDKRESPAPEIAVHLMNKGVEVCYHDPYVQEWAAGGSTVTSASADLSDIGDFDLVILLQNHTVYESILPTDRAAHILDTRGVLKGSNVEKL